MADYNQLKASIAAVIKTNNRKEITGQLLQNVLFQMTEVIGENYQLAGFATPQTNPHEPDQNVFYITDESGTFPYFDNIILGSGISFLMWKNGQWTSHTVNGVTQEWVRENFISKEYFRSLFRAYDANGDEILPNNDPEGTLPTVVDNIKAMVGFWTEQYISALGHGTGGGGGGGGGGATTLDGLDDVVILNPQNGQGLIFDSTSGEWINQNIPTGTDMATVWTALAGATNQQINISHLTDALATYATQTWVGQNYISIAYFDRLFRAYNGSTLVSHNDTTSTIDNIKAMFGFWTEFYVSALGIGGLQSPISLASLNDIALTTPIGDGQVLTYNATTGKWVNANPQTGATALANLTDVTLTTPAYGQVLLYDGTKWINSALKTINGNSLIGSGDIVISGGGGGSGNYLPTAGGSMYGPIYFGNNNIVHGANQSYYARLGAFDDHVGGVVLQSGNNTNKCLSIIDASWSYSILDVNNDSHIRIGRDSDLSVNGRNLPLYISYPSSMWLSDWIVGIGDSSKALLLGLRNGTASIGLYGVNKLVLEADYVGVGNYNAQYKLDVSGSILSSKASQFGNVRVGGYNMNDVDSNACIEMLAGTGYIDWHYYGNSSDYTSRIIEESSGTLKFICNIYSTAAITALSDARKKDVQGDAKIGVEQIADAPAVQFLWKGERAKEGLQVGTLAQYWQTVLPEVVMDKGGELSMQYGVAALVSAIITARKVVDHEVRIDKMEKWMKKWAEENDE